MWTTIPRRGLPGTSLPPTRRSDISDFRGNGYLRNRGFFTRTFPRESRLYVPSTNAFSPIDRRKPRTAAVKASSDAISRAGDAVALGVDRPASETPQVPLPRMRQRRSADASRQEFRRLTATAVHEGHEGMLAARSDPPQPTVTPQRVVAATTLHPYSVLPAPLPVMNTRPTRPTA